MGSVYRRGDSPSLWIGYTDAAGQRRLVSSGTADMEEAKRTLEQLELRVKAAKAAGLTQKVLTVRGYAESWLERRRARGIRSAKDDETRLGHAMRFLGGLPLADVSDEHVRDLMRSLETKGTLAPRTRLHVYGVLRVMFSDAKVERLIAETPCTLKRRRGELPEKRDKDPRWRAQAIFERQEVEALISDERIPERRRVLYALEFLCGVRVNEVTPRRWADYDAAAQPLGKLTFATAFAAKQREEKHTKTGHARQVPVHPTLAKVLAHWKLAGWAATYGRPPRPEDLMVPAPPHHRGRRTLEEATRTPMSSTSELKRLHESLAVLGLRPRRQHDARATFMTLSVTDGGIPHVLETVTHAKEKDVVAGYHRFPWAAVCAEVAKLNIQLREGRLIGMGRYAGATLPEVPAMTEEISGGGGNRIPVRMPPEASSGAVSAQSDSTSQTAGVEWSAEGAPQRSDFATPEEDPGGYEAYARRAGLVEVFRSGVLQ